MMKVLETVRETCRLSILRFAPILVRLLQVMTTGSGSITERLASPNQRYMPTSREALGSVVKPVEEALGEEFFVQSTGEASDKQGEY